MQYIAFIHGHQEEGWHQMEMFTTLSGLQWEEIPGYADLNRKVGYRSTTLDRKGQLIPLDPVATRADVYNGIFSTYKVSSMSAMQTLLRSFCPSAAAPPLSAPLTPRPGGGGGAQRGFHCHHVPVPDAMSMCLNLMLSCCMLQWPCGSPLSVLLTHIRPCLALTCP